MSDDSAWFPLDNIFNFLSQETFWARGLSRDVFDQSVTNSLCLAAYRLDGDDSHGELIGFARVVTDRATFAYLCDVLMLPALRGKGVSYALMDSLCEHPDLQTLHRTVLVMTGADWLYRKYDFADVPEGVGSMRLYRPSIYTAVSA